MRGYNKGSEDFAHRIPTQLLNRVSYIIIKVDVNTTKGRGWKRGDTPFLSRVVGCLIAFCYLPGVCHHNIILTADCCQSRLRVHKYTVRSRCFRVCPAANCLRGSGSPLPRDSMTVRDQTAKQRKCVGKVSSAPSFVSARAHMYIYMYIGM